MMTRDAVCRIGRIPARYRLTRNEFYADGERLPLDRGVIELAVAAHVKETGQDLGPGNGSLPCSLARRILSLATERSLYKLRVELARAEKAPALLQSGYL